MEGIELLNKFNKEYESLDYAKITCKSIGDEFLNAGISGEEKVYEILKKYAHNIKRDVVIKSPRKDFTSEIDFICELNGYVLVIEAKEWFGELDYNTGDNYARIKYVNLNGRYRVRYRMNPRFAIGGFCSDLLKYIGPNAPKKNSQMLRFLVFTRRDLTVKGSIDSSIKTVYLDEFEEELIKVANKTNNNPYSLNIELPSWDYYFNEADQRWYKITVLSSELKCDDLDDPIPTKDVDSLCYTGEDNKVVILFRDGRIEEHLLYRINIRLNSNKASEAKAIQFIKFNRELHN